MRYTAVGMAYHPKRGIVLAVPREGGKILRIDPDGKLATLLEKDPGMAHPVGVAAVGESDTLLVADNIADMLFAATIGGAKARVYHRFDGQKYTSQGMSVAVTKDKRVIFSSTGVPGVFRYGGGQSLSGDKPALPVSGSVAAGSQVVPLGRHPGPQPDICLRRRANVQEAPPPAGQSLLPQRAAVLHAHRRPVRGRAG